MNLTPEQHDQVAAELKRFASDLNLSDDQKEVLRGYLTEAQSKVADYLKSNPNANKIELIKQVASHRQEIRQRVENLLNPDQLKKWDAEAVKAKEFLGRQLAA